MKEIFSSRHTQDQICCLDGMHLKYFLEMCLRREKNKNTLNIRNHFSMLNPSPPLASHMCSIS